MKTEDVRVGMKVKVNEDADISREFESALCKNNRVAVITNDTHGLSGVFSATARGVEFPLVSYEFEPAPEQPTAAAHKAAADSLLERVIGTTTQRQDNYDMPLPNFLRIALLWSVWDGYVNDPLDVTFKMDLMKSARLMHDHNDDTLIDKAGYAVSCYERMRDHMLSLGYERGAEQLRYWHDKVRAGTMTPGEYVGKMYDLLLSVKGGNLPPPSAE